MARPGRTLRGGLTPARAGNTPSQPPAWRRRPAHPRTGGETPWVGALPQPCLGLTPARAGNTHGPRTTYSATGAHPRTGGEHRNRADRETVAKGSPPHGRGTPRAGRRDDPERGLTPARAGNTCGCPGSSAARRAHPRTGGEHHDIRHTLVMSSGSPPHGRGTHSAHRPADGRRGLTPARAGNTRAIWRSCPPRRAHPRTGGEHPWGPYDKRSPAGSPPHGRGTPRVLAPPRRASGLTPARAGNTARRARTRPGSWAHPRTGGEHDDISLTSGLVWFGSPPHGRGTQRPDLHRRQRPGLTPARAGNTSGSDGGQGSARAHPRTGGEHSSGSERRVSVRGSPPHGRGTPRGDRLGRGLRRLTPARAGNTTRPEAGRHLKRAHPRTGGEHNNKTLQTAVIQGSPPHGRGTPSANSWFRRVQPKLAALLDCQDALPAATPTGGRPSR